MNLAIRGIDGNIGTHNADTFHSDLHKDLKADFILACALGDRLALRHESRRECQKTNESLL